MNLKDMLEQLATIDGYEKLKYHNGMWWVLEDISPLCTIPEYFENDSALQRIINHMPEEILEKYGYELGKMFTRKSWWWVLTATCQQKTEAILRAYGKWVE
ncbi:MAG: hypothetical protein WC119_00540 [Synergistaceae bacterium]